MAAITGSRGHLRSKIITSCEELGIDHEGNISIIIRTFMVLKRSQAIHSIDMSRGVLIFAQKENLDPDSGEIYIYDKEGRVFWSLKFEKGSDDTTDALGPRQQFETLSEEYGLSDYAARPGLLSSLAAITNSRGA